MVKESSMSAPKRKHRTLIECINDNSIGIDKDGNLLIQKIIHVHDSLIVETYRLDYKLTLQTTAGKVR